MLTCEEKLTALQQDHETLQKSHNDAHKAEMERLTQAQETLQPHVRHKPGCSLRPFFNMGFPAAPRAADISCDCGLTRALSPPSSPEPERWVSEAEFQNHSPWCVVRKGRAIAHCNCDAPPSSARGEEVR